MLDRLIARRDYFLRTHHAPQEIPSRQPPPLPPTSRRRNPRHHLPLPPRPSLPHHSTTPKNRAPLAPNAFYPLPLGSIRPTGWLRDQLHIQANGLSGHLDETWPDVGPNSGWLGGTGESWERGPYFLDGLVPLAYQLDDPHLKAKAQKFIDWTLNHQHPTACSAPPPTTTGGPAWSCSKSSPNTTKPPQRPPRHPASSTRYFRYQLAELSHRAPCATGANSAGRTTPSPSSGSTTAPATPTCSTSSTSSTAGLRLAGQLRRLPLHRAHHRRTSSSCTEGKASATSPSPPTASTTARPSKPRPSGPSSPATPPTAPPSTRCSPRSTRYHGLPNGMFSCDEHLAGRNPSQGSELCTVVETMFSLEQSLAILGDPTLGDRLERLAFNALPGTFTDDMWAHQYNQEPNQVECSACTTSPGPPTAPSPTSTASSPTSAAAPPTSTRAGPSSPPASGWRSARRRPGRRRLRPLRPSPPPSAAPPSTIIQDTDYPFREHIRLTINPAHPDRLPPPPPHPRLGHRRHPPRQQPAPARPDPRHLRPHPSHLEPRRRRRAHLPHEPRAHPAASTTPSPSTAAPSSSPTPSAKAGSNSATAASPPTGKSSPPRRGTTPSLTPIGPTAATNLHVTEHPLTNAPFTRAARPSPSPSPRAN